MRGQPCLWALHMQRLQMGCQRLAIPFPDSSALRSDVLSLCAGQDRAVLKIIVSPGYVQRGYQRPQPATSHYYLECHPWPASGLYQTNTPIHLQLCQTRLGTQPLLAGIKHLNRLEQVLARNELAPDKDEGVMLNQQGEVVEGAMSNLMVRYAGRYITPPIEDCGIAGVVRGLLIKQAAKEHQAVEISPVTLEMLKQAEAVYSMNSLLGIRQVASFDGHGYAQMPMPGLLQQVSAMCYEPLDTVDNVT